MTLLFTQGIGKIQRYTKAKIRKRYVRRQLEERKGSCLRCGNCCKILFNCPFADFSNDLVHCKIYDVRFHVCRIFPIDERCLQDVNFECGFFFENHDKKKT